MKYGIVMATKDYDYVQDFIDEHLKIGFDRIIIYDGSEKTHVFEHPNVIIRRWDKPHTAECLQYNEHIKEFKHEKDFFTAFLDQDEIIWTKGIDIHEVMKPFEHYDSIGLNWRVFGSFIEEGNTSNKLVEKYLFHAPDDLYDPNGHNYIKSMAKNNVIEKMIDPHFCILKEGKLNKGVKGNIIKGSITKIKDLTTIAVNHYHFQDRDKYIKDRTTPIPGRITRSREEVASIYDACVPLCNQKLKE